MSTIGGKFATFKGPDATISGDGNPIGTIIMFPSYTPPDGYLLCDGATLDATAYPELAAIVGARLPDLRNAFPRGATGQSTITGFTRHQDTTRRPRTNFTGTTNNAGSHNHLAAPASINAGSDGNAISYIHLWANQSSPYSSFGPKYTDSQGNHSHNVTINGGGDSETAPLHVRLAFMIKAK